MDNLRALKLIGLMGGLTDEMVKKIVGITNVAKFKAGEYIFKEGDRADHFYAVIEGKVGLEIERDSSTRIRINDVNPNSTFGSSSMVETEQKLYITNSKALEDTSVFKWKASDLERLFHENYEMGFYFMKKLAKTLKTRIQIRDAQLAQYI